MIKLSVYIIFIIILNITKGYQLNEMSKEVLINQLIQNMELYTNATISRAISTDIKRLLQNIQTKIQHYALVYQNSRSYVNIIMKGFQIMILENKRYNALRFNMKLLSENITKVTYENANSNSRLKQDTGKEINAIVEKLKDFANNNSVAIEDAFEIVRNKVNYDYEQEIRVKLRNRKFNANNETAVPSISTIDDEDGWYLTNKALIYHDNLYNTPIDQCIPKNCHCVGNDPVNIVCDNFCELICSHKFQLQNWICDSVNNSDTIPLNLICNGIYDCKDKTDEEDCNYNSDSNMLFRANAIFKDLLQPLPNKVKDKRLATFRPKLRTLYNRIRFLNKNTTVNNTGDVQIVKMRGDVFDEILAIYDGFTNDLRKTGEIEAVFNFLTNIKLLIIKALKLSLNGNANISKSRCLCRENACAVAKCSKDCRRICANFSLFARYVCKSSDLKEIAIASVCNGKFDCPRLDDEVDCRKEPCRSHHLILLRRQLQELSKTFKGTRVKEFLTSWLTETLDKMKEHESGLKLKQIQFNDIRMEILMDLILEYEKYEVIRKDNGPGDNFGVFYKVAKVVVESRRLCGL